MQVAVVQAGDDRVIGGVDDLGADRARGSASSSSTGADRDDPVAVDQHRPGIERDAGPADHREARCRCGSVWSRRQRSGTRESCQLRRCVFTRPSPAPPLRSPGGLGASSPPARARAGCRRARRRARRAEAGARRRHPAALGGSARRRAAPPRHAGHPRADDDRGRAGARRLVRSSCRARRSNSPSGCSTSGARSRCARRSRASPTPWA